MNFFKDKKKLVNLIVIAIALIAVIVLCLVIDNKGDCAICHGSGLGDTCAVCQGTGENCSICDGDGYVLDEDGVCSSCGGKSIENPYFSTIISLLPPILAILLALITKEVYSSLFAGVIAGALFTSRFNLINTLETAVSDGIVSSLADSWNMGIMVFLVLLGIIVALLNKAGGAYAFGKWAKTNIKTKIGAQLATFALGVLIFVDDYFNCLTVGSVMRPVTKSKKISREKLAYLIDATAAPVCMIAPISSWAAAVSSTATSIGQNGIQLFISAIPFNFYSLLTIVMIITMSLLRIEYGPMKKYEEAAQLIEDIDESVESEQSVAHSRSRVFDLIIPIAVLIVTCIAGMLYTGGFFTRGEENYLNVIDAFSGCDASKGLSMGSMVALIIIIVYFIARRLLSFKESMECIPQGFVSMVPAMLILTLAWTLNSMTSSLGAKFFVYDLLNGAAEGLMSILPAVIFLVAVGLSFSTGTSWGTFGILIPIVVAVFSASDPILMTIGISACLAGAVCGDHCSPISDTTIMASAGAECEHLNHVSTQLPYALTVAAVSFISFIIAGFVRLWYVALPIGIILMIGTLIIIKKLSERQHPQESDATENSENA